MTKKITRISPSNFFTNVFYKKFTTLFTIIISWFFFEVSTIMNDTFSHSFFQFCHDSLLEFICLMPLYSIYHLFIRCKLSSGQLSLWRGITESRKVGLGCRWDDESLLCFSSKNFVYLGVCGCTLSGWRIHILFLSRVFFGDVFL